MLLQTSLISNVPRMFLLFLVNTSSVLILQSLLHTKGKWLINNTSSAGGDLISIAKGGRKALVRKKAV